MLSTAESVKRRVIHRVILIVPVRGAKAVDNPFDTTAGAPTAGEGSRDGEAMRPAP
jgi:hypothetical protein